MRISFTFTLFTNNQPQPHTSIGFFVNHLVARWRCLFGPGISMFDALQRTSCVCNASNEQSICIKWATHKNQAIHRSFRISTTSSLAAWWIHNNFLVHKWRKIDVEKEELTLQLNLLFECKMFLCWMRTGARARKTLWIVVIDVFCVIFIGIALLLRSLSLSSCSVEVEVEVPVCRAISSALFCRYQR